MISPSESKLKQTINWFPKNTKETQVSFVDIIYMKHSRLFEKRNMQDNILCEGLEVHKNPQGFRQKSHIRLDDLHYLLSFSSSTTCHLSPQITKSCTKPLGASAMPEW